MAVTLTDPTANASLTLYSAEEHVNEQSAALDASPFISFDSEQTFLSSLEQDARLTFTGTATGLRISRQSGFSNTPVEALAEWVVEFEAFVNGGQGDGYELSRDYRSDTFDGVVSQASWRRQGGEQLAVAWDLEFIIGDSVGVTQERSVPSVTTGQTYTVDGTTIDAIREFGIEKSQDFGVFRRAFADSAADNDITAESGARRRVTMTGFIKGDESARNTFDDNITSSLGQDTLIDVVDGLTGRTITGMIEDYETTDEAGRTRLGEFGLSVVEGTT